MPECAVKKGQNYMGESEIWCIQAGFPVPLTTLSEHAEKFIWGTIGLSVKLQVKALTNSEKF